MKIKVSLWPYTKVLKIITEALIQLTDDYSALIHATVWLAFVGVSHLSPLHF